ncbi:MAG: DUF2742 domain-containing protein [Mycobacterium sp.]|nr:DUF2742 domain-containing protein [Mycobacterium sp.]
MSDLIVTRAVDFYEVHRLVTPILDAIEPWPVAGTLTWQQLDDTDPTKWAAVLDIARYGTLHLQLRQEALTQASHDVSAAADWPAIARALRADRGPYIPRKATA